ncbi:MAG: hypothetical protein KME22_07740 [Hassallia sp. WJT32-NPBG1]|jgi:hypothetical protein|nr:hypothetical protein [Hassallia sp. WJT32-NPBG1]
MTTSNGKATVPVTDAKSLEITPVKQPRKPANRLNKVNAISLDLDAGSANCKFVINHDYTDTFPTIYKEVSGELPLGISGCFSIGSKNFAVGQVCHSLNGNLVEASRDNKIKKLDVWMIGALSSHPDLLTDIANGRKYKAKPARLKITLRLLSLSSCKRNDITKILQGVKTFTSEGTVFEVEIANTDYLFPEGYGAALEALRHIPEDVRGFDILDLGGGTITFSTYKVGKLPKAIEQTPGSGNGMKAVIDRLSIALSREDRGGLQFKKENIDSALRNSKPIGDGRHSVLYRHGVATHEIGDTVVYSLSEWVMAYPIVESLLNNVSQSLLNGRYVFATGGGFAISAIAEWIEKYVCTGIDNPKFFILDNPQSINLTGLSRLNISA